ncbi:GspH domain-containing protein [Rubrivivax sp. A210]|uniref:pilus assembly FimT family protein n=1 Tax=Rubrivivax sp. A210 TaxID=2772301 RepID=UPI001918DF7C|nr:GspH/FimT family pseudopilin [Rubrivivax sp. A210]CAD5372082.1 GspH domain-containing protein [Rubrivivax sp. A210]
MSKPPATGLTMIELMVVVAIVALLAMVAAPSFKRFIDVQRLRSINAQLITDIQFVRAEAASRNLKVTMMFDAPSGGQTCYALLTGDHTVCDCNRAPGTACSVASVREIRTVQVPLDSSISLGFPSGQTARHMRFDPATGRLETAVSDTFIEPTGPFRIVVGHPTVGSFITSVEVTGRPTTCSPSGQISGVPACP